MAFLSVEVWCDLFSFKLLGASKLGISLIPAGTEVQSELENC